MASVLVVDDERDYREELLLGLSRQGHAVVTADSGREAVDKGARFRPQVLIADWMLKDHIHGLQVAEALRAVRPDLQTIVVTGFGSDDLRGEADRSRVWQFIEKPFELDRIVQAVESAVTAPRPGPPRLPVGVVELGEAGAITYANPRARELFAQTEAGPDAERFGDFFPGAPPVDLDAAARGWVIARPAGPRATTWQVRSRLLDDGPDRLVVFRGENEPQYENLALIEMLLGTSQPLAALWPFAGRILLVDASAADRRFIMSMFEAAGAACYTVETHQEGLRLFEIDAGIRFVIVSLDGSADHVAALVRRLQTLRSDTVIVGHGPAPHREDFAAVGVNRFLTKPWSMNRLLELLAG